MCSLVNALFIEHTQKSHEPQSVFLFPAGTGGKHKAEDNCERMTEPEEAEGGPPAHLGGPLGRSPLPRPPREIQPQAAQDA